MEYDRILEAIKEYENMTSLEIQNQIKPIIKSYDKEFLCQYLNVSKDNLYRACKKLFVEKNERLQFTTYIKIMELGKNPEYMERKPIIHTKQTKLSLEEQKEKRKEYQRKYYETVTKKKRLEKKSKLQNKK